jgi:hypothetical protein
MTKRTFFALVLCLAFSAQAAEVAGVRIDDSVQAGGATLTLNGAGLRKLIFFNVYAMGLYLPKKTTAAAEAIAVEGPKRISLHMLRDVGAERFSSALNEGITANHTEAQLKALEPRIRELTAIMGDVKEAKKGMIITLDWNGSATQVGLDGKPAGKPIEGADFYQALLRIWLGENPVQDDLKKALLGGN